MDDLDGRDQSELTAEQAAQAIHMLDPFNYSTWVDLGIWKREMYRDQARAAIAVMPAEIKRLQQAAWDALGVLGFDQDGDKQPHGVSSPDLAKWLVEAAAEHRKDSDDEYKSLTTERDALQARLHAVACVRRWAHEDGKQFVFADDLRAALAPTEDGTE